MPKKIQECASTEKLNNDVDDTQFSHDKIRGLITAELSTNMNLSSI